MAFVSHIQHLQRAAFLREAAALQRTNTGGAHRLAEIAFPDPEGPDGLAVAVVATAGGTVRLCTSATRSELHAALALEGWAAPAPDGMTPPESTEPTLLVYADLLADVGDHLFLLTTFPEGVGRPDLVGSRLNAVRLADEAVAELELTMLGSILRVCVPLDSGVPLGVVPLVVAEWLVSLPRSAPTLLGTSWTYPTGGT
ncbi:hypothetical protein AB0A71_19970 [Kitasatospora aureofaciens]|uniref:hypothetical protein n=1 Tax=Kitasatospora aureofaciens TaxID=1894 RepID=UPI0033EA4D89